MSTTDFLPYSIFFTFFLYSPYRYTSEAYIKPSIFYFLP
nr:MAG TPA: hypothetical protein [Caudoviricetes sp.]DAW68647.1 MAG TPA: hypothetical protein [Caudoviricetes sp.]